MIVNSTPLHALEQGYVGARSCAQCHQKQYQLWKGSDHERAMLPATFKSVLGDFNNASIEHYGITSRFYQHNGKYYVETDNAEGELQEFEIAYTFGYYPLQQYLVAFPNGHYQTLTIAWDSRPISEGGQRWFHLYPDEATPSGDELHWTGTHFNWNNRCAACHSTNLQKNYNPTSRSYNTTWSEINVACEACHGPGNDHVEWASSGDQSSATKGLLLEKNTVGTWLRNSDEATAHLQGTNPKPDAQLAMCGSCHSRRVLIGKPDPHGNYHDEHQLQLPTPPFYYPDGQIRDEVFVLGSFLQSKMYRNGVVCSNCHEPHSLKLKATGNALCSQCHNPEVFDNKSHHHHPDGSGSQCVNCHMPETTYMVVDPRRDHSFRIPRPDLSEKLGAPNACTQCHTEKSNQWAADALHRWLSMSEKNLPHHYGQTINDALKGVSGSGQQLAELAQGGEATPIIRATALAMLRDFPSQETLEVARDMLRDSAPLIRLGAVKAIEMLPLDQRLKHLFPLLKDPVKSVRLEASKLLISVSEQSLKEEQKAVFNKAMEEYLDILTTYSDTPEGQLNLGMYYIARGDYSRAIEAYNQGIEIAPSYLPVYMNLADLYRALGQDTKSEPLLRKVISMAPDQAAPHHALGLMLVRQTRYVEAEQELALATQLEPQNFRFAYIYAVALESLGKADQALNVFEDLHRLQKTNLEILRALLNIHLRRRDRVQALKYAEKLQKLNAADPNLENLVKSLKADNGK